MRNSKTRWSNGRVASLALVMAISTLTSTGRAQQDPAEAQLRARQRAQILQQQRQAIGIQRGVIFNPNAPVDPDGKTTGVFVRDSAVAGEKLALAERMERLKEWDTSAEVYQEVLDGYADRVLPIHNDEKGQPDRFGSVTSVVQDRLAGWPEEGRSVYLARYELPARRLLEAADRSNRSDLMNVVNRYFLTSAGRDAALLLIESYFDHAEFIAAAMLSDRLLEKHPQVSDQSPLLLARSALCWHLAGDSSRAAKQATRLREKYPDATDTIGGKSRVLTEIVQAALASSRQVNESGTSNTWTVPFGANDRAAVAIETTDQGAPRVWAKLETIPFQSVHTNMPGEGEADLRGMFQRQREMGVSTGVLPSVDGNQLFFQDNASLYAYDTDRAAPIIGWLATYPGTGRYTQPGAASTPRGVQMTTTLTDRSVLAILGQPEMMNVGGPDAQTAVVCLDRATGRSNWKFAPNLLETEDEALRNAKPVGSVLVAGDSVYVVAHSRRQGAFEDSYLLCLALEDGSVRWTRHLASGNASRMNFDYNIPPQNPGDSHLAYADGSVFVCTDLGGIASVNAADGTLAWLSVYPRPLPTNPQLQWAAMNMGQAARVTPAYVGNPVIASNGLIISMPGDAENLFVHDAATGELRASVKMERLPEEKTAADPPEQYQVLVGLRSNRVIVSGSRSIALLDLEKILAANDSPERTFNDVMVRYRVFSKTDHLDDTIRGRPFITDKCIYVPTAWKMFVMNADASLAKEMYPPAQDTWLNRADEAPGNLVYAGDSLIVAGPDRVSIYSDLTQLRRRMEAAVAADVRSISPRLRYCDALFNAGQNAEAIRWLDAAIEGLTSNGMITPGPDRDRIFEQSMAMFRRLATRAHTQAEQGALLERLARTADTPQQQVGLQLSIAFFAKQADKPADAVAAYQKLIDEPNLGGINLNGPEGSLAASDYAAAEIDQLIKASGPEVYQAVESRAAAALAGAQTTGDVSKLLAVLASYPNSRAGQDAVGVALQQSRSGGVASIDLLRRVGATPIEPAQKLPLYHALLRAELARGQVFSALGRARRIAQLDGSFALGALALSGESPTSIAASTPQQAVESLQRLAYQAEDDLLPDLNPPDEEPIFEMAKVVSVNGLRTILVPMNPRPDRVVAVAANRRSIHIFQPGQSAPLQTIAMPQREITDTSLTLWRGDDLVLVAPQQLSMLDTKGGAVRWTFAPSDAKAPVAAEALSLAIDEQGLTTTSVPQAKRQTVVMNPTLRRPGQIVNRLPQQQVIIRQIVDGEQVAAWEPDEPGQQGRETISFTRFVGDAVVVITSSGRVIGLDANTGAVRWQSSFHDRAPSSVAVYDDLIALSGNNDNSSRLVVYRGRDGAQVINQSYTGAPQRRLNTLQVSREGYLAAVHADFIDVFDLGSGDSAPIATFDGQGQFIFAATRSQDQVQFCADKLLVMVNDPNRGQQVRMFDTLTLQPTTVVDPKTRQTVERQLLPLSPDGVKPGAPSAQMYVQKDRLLLRNGRDFTMHMVPAPDAFSWQRPRDSSAEKLTMSSQSPLFVRDGVLIVDWPERQRGQPNASPHLQYFKRERLDNGRESGRILDDFNLARDNAKMFDRVQAVNGGLVTVWTDGVMSFYPTRKK